MGPCDERDPREDFGEPQATTARSVAMEFATDPRVGEG